MKQTKKLIKFILENITPEHMRNNEKTVKKRLSKVLKPKTLSKTFLFSELIYF